MNGVSLHKITIERFQDEYYAFLDGDRSLWDKGKTPNLAIGNLIVGYHKELGFELDYQNGDDKPFRPCP